MGTIPIGYRTHHSLFYRRTNYETAAETEPNYHNQD